MPHDVVICWTDGVDRVPSQGALRAQYAQSDRDSIGVRSGLHQSGVKHHVYDADYPDGEGDVEDQCFRPRKQWIAGKGSDPYGRQPP